MTPLLYVAIVLGISAVAVTVFGLLTADEGYEDEHGFHTKETRESHAEGMTASQDADAHPHYFAG